jgi:hypothetical protein
MVVKNWLDDPHLNCKATTHLKDYMKVEYAFGKESYNMIEIFDISKELSG